MRQSLEPKEEQIDNLKDQLLKLEEDFEDQYSQITHYGEELRKHQSKIDSVGIEITQQEEKTKEKKAIILKFAQDVQKIVQMKNDQAYITGLMKLNQDYVKSEVAYKDNAKKRDPEAIEELDKQLHYMERTIAALRTNTTKNSERIRIENGIKTKENTHLIDDLNRLKFENKKQSVILQKKKEEYKRLEHEQSKLVKERNMVYHEYNQMLQRREQRVQSGSREDGDRRQEGRAGSSKGPR